MTDAPKTSPSPRVPRLMLVTDRHRTRIPLAHLVQQALAGGVDGVQLREKDLAPMALTALAERLVAVIPDTVPLLVNGDVQLATRFRTGVHLPEKGPPVAVARAALGSRVLIGRSVHSPEEAANSAGADYVLAGNVFETGSKPGRDGIGLDRLRQIIEAAPARVLAIGGINVGNAEQVLEAGAHGIAVISAIAAADSPVAASKELREIVERSTVSVMDEQNQTSIVVNGKENSVSPGTTVASFLASKGFQDRLVVVERNGSILSRADFASTTLQPNDRLEIVHFVGGG
ncbi:MAG: sulfur carrier protein ThiS [Chloroflexota bacterium]|nr:sulfur carrier protein ThiS [Chloroflexota bacterium]